MNFCNSGGKAHFLSLRSTDMESKCGQEKEQIDVFFSCAGISELYLVSWLALTSKELATKVKAKCKTP